MGVLERAKTRKIFFGTDHDALVRIVVINILITAVLFLIRSIYQLSGIELSHFQSDIAVWFVLPSHISDLLVRPWTLLTYMFTHLEILSLLANMLWLWAFGFIFQDLIGRRKLAPLYLYGGLAGGFVFLSYCYFVPALRDTASSLYLTGANAPVIAIAVAATYAAPKYRIFPMLNGGIRLWMLTVVYVVLSIAGTSLTSPATYSAALAGALVGILFISRLNNGHDPGRWMTRMYDWFFDLFNPDKMTVAEAKKKHIFYDTHGKSPFHKKPTLNQERIDEILDKINLSGYHSLTVEEKDILHRAGEEEL